MTDRTQMFVLNGKKAPLLLALIIILFIVMESVPDILMPELCNDEACTGTVSLRLLHNLPQRDYVYFLGRYFQLSDNGHHGALESYILAPFLFFGGPNVVALRIAPLIMGVAIIILCYCLGLGLFNASVGILAALLLTTNTSFLLLMKMGGFFGFSLPFFTLASLLFFLTWHTSRKNTYLYLGMFILGLGWNVKAYFIWFIVSLFIAALLFYASKYRPKIKTFFFCTLFFLLGALPIISVYSRSGFFGRFAGRGFISQAGFNNLDILRNLSARFGHLNLILQGSLYWGDSSAIDYDYRLFIVFSFWFCALFLLYLSFIKKQAIVPSRRIGFILMLTLTMFLSSIFTFTELRKGHFIILLPFLQLIMAVAIFQMWRLSGSWARRIPVYILALGLVMINLARCAQLYQMLRQEGIDKSRCNITMLSTWLTDNNILNPVCFTPCLLEFSSNLKIQPYYLPWYLVSCHPEIRGQLKEKIKNASPDDYFVFGMSADLDARDTFNEIAKESNKEVVIRKEFFWPDGKPRFVICSLE